MSLDDEIDAFARKVMKTKKQWKAERGELPEFPPRPNKYRRYDADGLFDMDEIVDPDNYAR
jgi:hypothetical protein